MLDLDETLIHSEVYIKGKQYDKVINVDPHGTHLMGIFVRPGIENFLRKLNKKFEVVIFTASREDYAGEVINFLDPHKIFFSEILDRRNCSIVGNYYVKDLTIIKNRELKNMIIVDNYIYSFANQIFNGVPIKGYFTGSDDYELDFLAEAFNDMVDYNDCRTFNKDYFKAEKFYDMLRR